MIGDSLGMSLKYLLDGTSLLDAEVEGGRVLGEDVDVRVGILEEGVLPERAGVVPARLMHAGGRFNWPVEI